MASFALSPMLPAADRRVAGMFATLLVHAALVLGWHMARTPPPGHAEEDDVVMQWLRLPPPAPAAKPAPGVPPDAARPAPAVSRARAPAHAHAARPGPAAARTARDPASVPSMVQEASADASSATGTPSRPDAASILENARRSVAAIDRALRKESKPLIVAPPDSPALRMRRGMEQAHAMAAPRIFEAPKVEELANNTGDGARRTRVITGNRTYCITERSPATNVEMIEMHGKIRLTTCPTHEEPAKRQEWRTAQD